MNMSWVWVWNYDLILAYCLHTSQFEALSDLFIFHTIKQDKYTSINLEIFWFGLYHFWVFNFNHLYSMNILLNYFLLAQSVGKYFMSPTTTAPAPGRWRQRRQRPPPTTLDSLVGLFSPTTKCVRLGGDDKNRPKRCCTRRLGPRYVFSFMSNLCLLFFYMLNNDFYFYSIFI